MPLSSRRPQPLSASSASLLHCPESPDDVASWASDNWAPLPLPSSADASTVRPIAALLAAEPDHMPLLDSLPQSPVPRLNAVNWILNVNEFYQFRPVTAFLAVNYLDRFLSVNTLPGQNVENGGRWPMQLLSVSCVSVAAKMEETHVPLLLDLQILDPKFVFEPKTIRRMELLLMSSLNWRMRAVTPFDFVNHFADLAKPELLAGSRAVLNSRAAGLIVKTCRVVEFLAYRPSEIAAAAVISATKGIADISDGWCTDLLKRFAEWINEENVRSCIQLMEDSLLDTCLRRGKPVNPQTPQSPIGVIDAAACRSCDSQKSSAATTPTSGLDPPAKRRRIDENICTDSIIKGPSIS